VVGPVGIEPTTRGNKIDRAHAVALLLNACHYLLEPRSVDVVVA
jgi:hypothetical protein